MLASKQTKIKNIQWTRGEWWTATKCKHEKLVDHLTRVAVNKTGGTKDQGQKWIKMGPRAVTYETGHKKEPRAVTKKSGSAIPSAIHRLRAGNKCNWRCNEFKLAAKNTMGSNEPKLAVWILRTSIIETGSKNTWASTHVKGFKQIKMAVQILRQQQIKSSANTVRSDEWHQLWKGWWQQWMNLVTQRCKHCGQEWTLNFEPGAINNKMAEKNEVRNACKLAAWMPSGKFKMAWQKQMAATNVTGS